MMGWHSARQGAWAPAIRCWRRLCPALSTSARGCGCCLQVSPALLEKPRASPPSPRRRCFCTWNTALLPEESGGDESSLPPPHACSLGGSVASPSLKQPSERAGGGAAVELWWGSWGLGRAP